MCMRVPCRPATSSVGEGAENGWLGWITPTTDSESGFGKIRTSLGTPSVTTYFQVQVPTAAETVAALAGAADAAVGATKIRAPPSMAMPAMPVASTFEILCISHLLSLIHVAFRRLAPACWTHDVMVRQGMGTAE